LRLLTTGRRLGDAVSKSAVGVKNSVVTKTLGEGTMKKERLGRILFVVAAGISFLFSVSLWFSGMREEGLFVGLWVPSILSFGSLLLSGERGVRK
jgi:hypothetical protein